VASKIGGGWAFSIGNTDGRKWPFGSTDGHLALAFGIGRIKVKKLDAFLDCIDSLMLGSRGSFPMDDTEANHASPDTRPSPINAR
jgi:hypothetical protein